MKASEARKIRTKIQTNVIRENFVSTDGRRLTKNVGKKSKNSYRKIGNCGVPQSTMY